MGVTFQDLANQLVEDALPPADGQPVIIEELVEGGQVLVLGWKDRPEPEVEVGSVQRSDVTWYPGRRDALVNIMGIEENAITLRGLWHDDAQRIVGRLSPLDLLRQARSLLAGLNRCRLVWGQAIRRNGRVTEVTPSFVRDRVIQYTIVFEVDEALEVYDRYPSPQAATNLRVVRQAADLALRAVNGTIAFARFGLSIPGSKKRPREVPPYRASATPRPFEGG